MYHISVLKDEVIKILEIGKNKDYVDATLGNGGYAIEILKKNGPEGKVIGIDLNKKTLSIAQKRLEKMFGKEEIKKRVVFINDNFANIKQILSKLKIKPKGIVADLGLSSWLLEKSKKGFSFQKDEVLDMRFDSKKGLPAYEVINIFPEGELRNIFEQFGEEKRASLIAKKIIQQRKKESIITTFDLKDIIENLIGEKAANKTLARIFQALRIFVNNELNNLERFLNNSFEILPVKGVLAVVSFHSLEDRIVKNFFKQKKQNSEAIILTKKPIRPSGSEIKKNKKSRSAKLRAIKKIKI